ncbi:hypothetical protein HOK15_03565 [Candidatus Falkowbacteria bacterium]|nr:hypothetical protein [Candidatus Falkowbacteria bacterium]
METVTKTSSKTKLSTKQKVLVGVSIGALFFSVGGFLTAMGNARGFGFGYPFMRRPAKRVRLLKQKQAPERPRPTPYGPVKTKTMLPAYNDWCTIRSSTGGTITVPCSNLNN